VDRDRMRPVGASLGVRSLGFFHCFNTVGLGYRNGIQAVERLGGTNGGEN